MKKYLMTISALLLALAVTSCGTVESAESSVTLDLPVVTTTTEETESTGTTTESAQETTKKSKTTEADENSEETTAENIEDATEAPTEEQAEVPTEATEPPTEAPTTEPPTEAPPVLSNVQFNMDMLKNDAGGVVSALGNPVDIQSATGCLSNGADQKIYVYEGLTVKCYVIDGAEYIYEIDIISEKYPTSAGITVGNTKDDVIAAYGAGEEMGKYLTYYNDSEDKEIDFEIADDIVQSIIFYTAV